MQGVVQQVLCTAASTLVDFSKNQGHRAFCEEGAESFKTFLSICSNENKL